MQVRLEDQLLDGIPRANPRRECQILVAGAYRPPVRSLKGLAACAKQQLHPLSLGRTVWMCAWQMQA